MKFEPHVPLKRFYTNTSFASHTLNDSPTYKTHRHVSSRPPMYTNVLNILFLITPVTLCSHNTKTMMRSSILNDDYNYERIAM